MKLNKIKNSVQDNDNLLPLVNIIFLLLIFFMLAGVIAKQKEMYDVELASAIIEDYIDTEENIIFIKSNGDIIFNDMALPIDDLDKKLTSIKDDKIIVAADKSVTTGKLNKILLKINKNKISNVTLLSNEK